MYNIFFFCLIHSPMYTVPGLLRTIGSKVVSEVYCVSIMTRVMNESWCYLADVLLWWCPVIARRGSLSCRSKVFQVLTSIVQQTAGFLKAPSKMTQPPNSLLACARAHCVQQNYRYVPGAVFDLLWMTLLKGRGSGLPVVVGGKS